MELFDSIGKNDDEEANVLSTIVPDVTDSVENKSLERSVCSSSHKRKHVDDSDSAEGNHKKNAFNSSSYCVVSPWEFRRLKADLMESQAQRIKLEDRIDQLHKKNKEAVIFFDKEKTEMKSQLEANRTTIKDLEFRLNKVRKREGECREELNGKVKEYELLKLKLLEKISTLETENDEHKSRINQLESEQDKKMFILKNNIENLENSIKKCELKIMEKEELCSRLNSKLASVIEDAKKYEDAKNELFLTQLKVKDLQNEIDEFREAKNLTIALSEKALRVPELEKELTEKTLQVANLKQFLHNNIILEEMVHDLKTKLAVFEGKENELPQLKAKIVELESELDNWMTLALDFGGDKTRNSLRTYIESLQRKELAGALEINNLNGMISSADKKMSSLQIELERVKTQNEKLQGVMHKLKVEVQLLRKKSLLVSRERDSYRQQLDLYEKDLTLTGFPVKNESDDAVSQMKKRISNLEASIEEYRRHVEALETQLKEYQAEEPFDDIEKCCKLKEEIKKLEENNRLLTKLRDELEQKLETRAVRGEFLSPNTKVLHFRNNPVFEAEKKREHDINELREECDKLRARVKLLEAGDVFNLTQKVSEDVKSCGGQKIAELEKELQSANLKMQRLKEVFKKTSQEFRDVSYMLLGYRIDLASNSKLYKLYNMYSTSPSDFLMFQQTKTGTMEMLGTTFAESMSKLVDEYLHKGNSIPAFLSAVTLQLYGLSAQSDEEEEEEEENDDDDDNGNDDDDDDDNVVDDDDDYPKDKNTDGRSSKEKFTIEPIELD